MSYFDELTEKAMKQGCLVLGANVKRNNHNVSIVLSHNGCNWFRTVYDFTDNVFICASEYLATVDAEKIFLSIEAWKVQE